MNVNCVSCQTGWNSLCCRRIYGHGDTITAQFWIFKYLFPLVNLRFARWSCNCNNNVSSDASRWFTRQDTDQLHMQSHNKVRRDTCCTETRLLGGLQLISLPCPTATQFLVIAFPGPMPPSELIPSGSLFTPPAWQCLASSRWQRPGWCDLVIAPMRDNKQILKATTVIRFSDTKCFEGR